MGLLREIDEFTLTAGHPNTPLSVQGHRHSGRKWKTRLTLLTDLTFIELHNQQQQDTPYW